MFAAYGFAIDHAILRSLHVAMQIGLYHHRLRDARRVVSEGILTDLPC